MKKKTVVTSALPYANGPIHIGHLVEYIQTDIFVRALKLSGEDVIYCCANDTHGTPIEVNAKKEGIPPEKLIQRYFIEHRRDFEDFNIHFDNFYTTNSSENKELSDYIFLKLKENGDIYTKEVELTYCPNCKRFLPDRFVKGKCPSCGAENQYGDNCEVCNSTYKPTDLIDPHCVICGTKPITKKSLHYFFKLSNYSGKLKKWLIENKNLQEEIKNYILNWIEEGLNDWDISRDAPYFGFKIVGEEDKYYYVWLDAPIGYIASTRNLGTKMGFNYEDYWKSKNGRIIHFIGKDIIYFHFLFWPAMLMGSGFNLPEDIVVHGFLKINNEKMSKSRGTFITARDYLEKLNPEYLRYYYARSLSRKLSDIDLDIEDFKEKINHELIANFGNFVNRSFSFLYKNFNGKTSERFNFKELEEKILKKANDVLNYYKMVNFKSAIKEIMEISDMGNKFFQDMAPWKLIKEDREKAHEVLTFSVNIVKILSILLKPVIPTVSNKIERILNLPHLKFSDLKFDYLSKEIKKPEILFEKLEEIDLIKKDPFTSVDLRVGKVIEVFPHPKADKLLILKVDFGSEKRQIVAGIKKYYSEEELKGKKIVVVFNLKPAKLRGEKSNGMLLAASSENDVGVLTVDGNLGDMVRPEGIEFDGTEQIDIEHFLKVNLVGKNGIAYYGEKVLMCGDKKVEIDKGISGKIK